MDPERTHKISNCTGLKFQEELTKLASSSEWKGGKLHTFQFDLAEHTLTLFEIRAVKKQSPIIELLKFDNEQEHERMRWEDAKEYLEGEAFTKFYYENFLEKKLRELDNDIRNMTIPLKICFMLTFEIARCSLQSRNQFVEAISIALKSEPIDREENITNLCKMFPQSVSTKIEDERREYARDCIFRRKKMDQVFQINKVWPQGENAEDLVEMLSKDPIERKYAFKKFLERKKNYEDILLDQNPKVLNFFQSILTAINVEDANRAFQQLNLIIERENS